jgi:radical SAM protein with 4Fe4S-binding SPASM domain
MHALEELLSAPATREALLASLSDPFTAPAIRCAKFKITARCNLRCSFCQYWRMQERDELTTDECRRILAELAASGCVKVHFSGGEATLRKDVFQLLAFAAGMGMKANITTNGTLLNEARARELVEAGTHGVSLSLDGPDAKCHDALRGVPGAFDRTVRAVRLLQREAERAGGRPRLRLNTVLTRHNYRRLPEIIDLAVDLGFIEVHPMPVDERGENPINRLTRKDIRTFNAYIAPLAAQARQRAGFSLAPQLVYPFGQSDQDVVYSARGKYARGYFERRPCYVPWLHIFIAWNGDVYLCCMARGKTPPLGNLRRNTIEEVFNGDAYRSIRRQFLSERPKVCHRCDMFVAENQQVERMLRPSRASS